MNTGTFLRSVSCKSRCHDSYILVAITAYNGLGLARCWNNVSFTSQNGVTKVITMVNRDPCTAMHDIRGFLAALNNTLISWCNLYRLGHYIPSLKAVGISVNNEIPLDGLVLLLVTSCSSQLHRPISINHLRHNCSASDVLSLWWAPGISIGWATIRAS